MQRRRSRSPRCVCGLIQPEPTKAPCCFRYDVSFTFKCERSGSCFLLEVRQLLSRCLSAQLAAAFNAVSIKDGLRQWREGWDTCTDTCWVSGPTVVCFLLRGKACDLSVISARVMPLLVTRLALTHCLDSSVFKLSKKTKQRNDHT